MYIWLSVMERLDFVVTNRLVMFAIEHCYYSIIWINNGMQI